MTSGMATEKCTGARNRTTRGNGGKAINLGKEKYGRKAGGSVLVYFKRES